jgi:segregation and condensation protein B
MIPDDFIPVDGFVQKAIESFRGICLTTYTSESRGGKECWTHKKVIDCGDVWLTGWTDMCFVCKKEFFDELVEEINDQLERVERPYRIVKIAGGFQFATTPAHGLLVQRLLKAKNRRRLTQAALETVAIIAYRQPITKAEIDAIRGVNSGEVVNSLVEKQLVAMVGRAETLGKPLLYGTTEEFLRVFGLNDISDLPKLREIDDLIKTTTTMIDLDDSISIKTDHRTLRKQLALLLDGDSAQPETDAGSTVEATSGAYWHHSMENEAEQGLVEDPEPGTWEHDETPKDVDNLANPNETRD